MAKPRVVLDCNVYFRSFVSPKGIARHVFHAAESRAIEVFVSRYILEELKDVLARPEFSAKFPHFSPENLKAFLDRIKLIANYVRMVEPRFRLSRDPKDSPCVDLAIDADADFLVTTDRDLLDLMTGYDLESKEFRQRFRRIEIVDPARFLEIISEMDLALRP